MTERTEDLRFESGVVNTWVFGVVSEIQSFRHGE
jgi:hypothetical protein